jgi:hypothetical protein
MPHFIVLGAAAIGAVDPSGKHTNYFLNYTGSNGGVIHLSGGDWRFLSTAAGDAEEATSEKEVNGPELGPTSAFYSYISAGVHGPTCIL